MKTCPSANPVDKSPSPSSGPSVSDFEPSTLDSIDLKLDRILGVAWGIAMAAYLATMCLIVIAIIDSLR